MFAQGDPAKVFVAMRPVDFRNGIDGLALAVQEMFGRVGLRIDEPRRDQRHTVSWPNSDDQIAPNTN